MSGKHISLLCALSVILAASREGVLALDPILPPPVAQRDQLVGSWSAQYGNVRHVIAFKQDLTFAGKMFTDGTLTDEYSGTWHLGNTIEGDILSYTYTHSKTIRPGTRDKDKLAGFTGDTFSVLTADKRVRSYQRLSKQESR